ncbi:MAG: peptidoglycan-binding protein [Alphaproteobacteria bacterium]|nr:peptidoglycan-binding protein [Alphaproteobacteria bacterium]
MDIKLSKPIASNGNVEENDVWQLKKILNMLGYYQPQESTGITGIPDAEMIAALAAFQADQGLKPTGEVKPDDATVAALRAEAKNKAKTKYIWSTVGDNRVRPEHAALEGEERSWGESPNPGEEPNCRCWGVPLDENKPVLTQEVISRAKDKRRWSSYDFVQHFYFGSGKTIDLTDAGLQASVLEHAKTVIFPRVELQIIEAARAAAGETFTDSFERSYDFGKVSFSLGNSTVKGEIKGTITKKDGELAIDAQVEYLFSDRFTDPLSIRQGLNGTSSTNTPDPYTEIGGTAYDIVGRWVTKVEGTISATPPKD